MPLSDYVCPNCGRVETDVLHRPGENIMFIRYSCPTCGVTMVRIPGVPVFKIKGHSEKNLYNYRSSGGGEEDET